MAVDIGASGGRAVLGRFNENRLDISEVRRFPNRMVDIHGHKHWDIPALYEEIKECLRAVPDAGSFGIDTWGVDYGYVGPDGDLLGLPFAYRDSRTSKSIPFVHEKISPDELYSLTGIQFLPFNTIFQVADDVLSHPWLVKNADRFLMIPDLLGYLLTGVPVNEYTNASTSGFLEVANRDWAYDLLKKIGFNKELLVEPVQPASLKARLTDTVRNETGSDARLAVVASHDTASAVTAIPAIPEPGKNWAFISSGTWSLVGMESETPVVSDRAREANFTNEGGVDGTTRFLTNVTGLWLLEELRRMWLRDGEKGADDYQFIISEAENAPPFRSLVNPDHPSFVAPADMRIAISEFCRVTGQTVPKGIGPFARCVFESLALAYRSKIIQLSDITGRSLDKIHIVGGGSRNEYLCKLTADACGIPVIAGPVEATSIGNLIVQAVANGLIGSISYGRRIIANSFSPLEYAPSRHDIWDPVAVQFQQLMQVSGEK